MNQIKGFFTLLLASAPMVLGAVVVNTKPGNLQRDLAGDDPETLVVTGSVNMTDLEFISTLSNLRSLDLLDVQINAYEGPGSSTALTKFPWAELPAYSLAGCKATSVILPLSLTSIGDGAMMGSCIESVAVPSGVKSIGAGAFAGCSRLRSVTVPASVTKAGYGLFKNCEQLVKVTYESHIVPEQGFAGCVAITDVLAPNLVTVSRGAFVGCTALKEMTFPRTVCDIEADAFAHSGLEKVDLTSCLSLKAIGERAFACCQELKSVVFYSGMAAMGQGAFLADSTLTTLKLPDSMTALEPLTLAGTKALKSDPSTLSSSLESIGDYAMAQMKSAVEIKLPAKVAYIGTGAMAQTDGLESIDARDLMNVPSLGADVWEDVNQQAVSLKVNPDLANAFMEADQWKEFNILQSGIDSPQADAASLAQLRYRVVNDCVELTCDQPIDRATLYDLRGTVMAMGRSEAGGAVVNLPLPREGSMVVIVVAELSTGQKATLKISI